MTTATRGIAIWGDLVALLCMTKQARATGSHQGLAPSRKVFIACIHDHRQEKEFAENILGNVPLSYLFLKACILSVKLNYC